MGPERVLVSFLSSRSAARRLRSCCLAGALSFLLALAPVCSWAASVLVLLSEAGGAYNEFAEALKSERSSRGGFSLTVATRTEFSPGDVAGHDMVIAAGASALRALVQADVTVPVLSVLVPQGAFETIAADSSRRWSAIHIDQPFSRQLALIRMALPGARRVGVVVDAAAVDKLQPLRSALSSTSLQLSVGTFTGEANLFPVLTQVLEKADVFLALPDPQIHNAGTVRNLLLTSFRARVPVVGFSSAYARAGAVMSLYSSPDQIARQAADAVTQWMRDRSWPHPQHPRHFTVSVNAHVARSLGLKMDDGDLLRDRLIRQEQMP